VRRWERWTFGLLSLVVAATGIAYFWMKYLLATDDPFAVVNHPWQPLMLSAHVVASPALLLMFGIILNSHIMRKLGAKGIPNRKSGLTSLISFFVMTASGYLLQMVTAPTLLRALIAAHVASGVLFTAVYVIHLVISVRLARRSAAPLLARTA
jgi:uncharacterized membrane protein